MRKIGVNLTQMAKPKNIRVKPTALITIQRLTNNPGAIHLNQRLTLGGVRWETRLPNFRCSVLNFRMADLADLKRLWLMGYGSRWGEKTAMGR
ncbi:hypothetical protein D082_08600 [Synechocystis sp. PCC 6714]|nr:hypothetical protein D082_08600 [Synechocystis sp. PCC 6714]